MSIKRITIIQTIPFVAIFLILFEIFAVPQIAFGAEAAGTANYVCWNNYGNPINVSNFNAMDKTFGNSTIAFQQNFILKSKSNSSMLWYQYVYAPFNHYFTLEVWKDGESISSTFLNPGNMNFVPKNLYLYNTKTSNNTIEVIFNTTSPNSTLATYLTIPNGYYVANGKVSTNSLNEYGYYDTEDFEIDFNRMPKNSVLFDIFSLEYYVITNNQVFSFQTCNRFN